MIYFRVIQRRRRWLHTTWSYYYYPPKKSNSLCYFPVTSDDNHHRNVDASTNTSRDTTLHVNRSQSFNAIGLNQSTCFLSKQLLPAAT